MPDDLELRIARLRLEPGDVLVLKATERLPHETARCLGDQARQIVGADVRVMVLDSQLDLSVLTKAEIEAKVAESAPAG